jgi:hypothetical protein
MKLEEAIQKLNNAGLIAENTEFDESTVKMISIMLDRALDNAVDNIADERYGVDEGFPSIEEETEVRDQVRAFVRRNIKELI